MTEKFKLAEKADLRVFCITVVPMRPSYEPGTVRLPGQPPQVREAEFVLCYSLDEATETARRKYGDDVVVMMHANRSLRSILDLVDEKDLAEMVGVGMIPAVVAKPETAEMKREDFLNNIAYIAGKGGFVEERDVEPLREILGRAIAKGRSESHTQNRG